MPVQRVLMWAAARKWRIPEKRATRCLGNREVSGPETSPWLFLGPAVKSCSVSLLWRRRRREAVKRVCVEVASLYSRCCELSVKGRQERCPNRAVQERATCTRKGEQEHKQVPSAAGEGSITKNSECMRHSSREVQRKQELGTGTGTGTGRGRVAKSTRSGSGATASFFESWFSLLPTPTLPPTR
jgi:hypothetical protein